MARRKKPRSNSTTGRGRGKSETGQPSPDALALTRYNQKRRQEQTSEPFDAEPPSAAGQTRHGQFVVHHHAARQTHFDLRLEVGGVLLSFAVPKGPSLDPTIKRLAVQTEPHPLAYLEFEDVIPEGNYGAGAMIAWDRGHVTYLEGTAEEGLTRHKIDFVLFGYKLRGRYALIQTGHRAGGDPSHWILLKKADAHASTDDPVSTAPESVYSGYSVTELPTSAARLETVMAQAQRYGGRKLETPMAASSISPMLCRRPSDETPQTRERLLTSEHHLYELKLDGVRLFGKKRGTHASLFFRSARPAHSLFPEIASALQKLPMENVLLDGELVALGEDGRPHFETLASRLHGSRTPSLAASRSAPATRLTYWVFDVLMIGEWDTTEIPLLQRKALLQSIVPRRGPISFLDHVEERGTEVFSFCEDQRLEGVVAKRRDSTYQPGVRSHDWIKIKREQEDDFVVVGWTNGSSAARDLGALELAVFRNQTLQLVGRVGSGFSEADLEALLSVLRPIEREQLIDANGELQPAPTGQHFSEPELVVTVRHQGLSSHGRLRFPVFVRLRTDKTMEALASDMEANDLPIHMGETERSGLNVAQSAPMAPQQPDTRSRGRVGLTNQNKVFFPDDGITKGDICDYFEAISPTLLPYLEDRPAVLVRYPDGIEGKSFYQWRVPPKAPSWLRSEPLPGKDGQSSKTTFVIDSLDALLFIANLGCIPLHIFAHQSRAPDRCQFATIDFDVGEGTFRSAVKIAKALLTLLEDVGLPGFSKTSGQSGIHVHIALGANTPFEAARGLTELLAHMLLRQFPKEATMERRKDKRGKRVLLDVGQVGPRRTVVAPYSPRAIRGAQVATPLTTEELNPVLNPASLTVHTVLGRVATHGDPMASMLTAKPDLTLSIQKLEQHVSQGS